jgi:hypothetical protein
MRQVMILALCLSVGACAAGPATRSGFLQNYDGLVAPGPDDSLIAQHPPCSFQLGSHDTVMIEPPQVLGFEPQDVDADRLRTVFAESLAQEFGQSLRLVQVAGPGTLRIRAAITDARKANVPLNILSQLLIWPVSRGGVSAEAEVIDVRRGERVAALSWTRKGAAMTAVTAPFARYGDARSGLRSFARRLRAILDPRLISQCSQGSRSPHHRR